jgi:hypothetical protein
MYILDQAFFLGTDVIVLQFQNPIRLVRVYGFGIDPHLLGNDARVMCHWSLSTR